MPKINWEDSTSEVLTMEYCPGVKINRVAELDRLGLDRVRLARLSVESYLQQLVRPGPCSRRPHPPNPHRSSTRCKDSTSLGSFETGPAAEPV